MPGALGAPLAGATASRVAITGLPGGPAVPFVTNALDVALQ